MSSVHCIVVWEYQSQGLWVPHTPGVTRTLERAYAKKLTRVVLADADPALKGHYVNLRTLTQCQDMPEGRAREVCVRRSCFGVHSVGGRGARWEWARLAAPPHASDLHYEPMPMELQCLVEERVCAGDAGAVVWREWAVSAARGAARARDELRVVRRRAQPPYPLARIHPPPALPPANPHPHNPHPHGSQAHHPPPAVEPTLPRRGVRIPQQHTGSSVQSVQSVQSAQSGQSVQSCPAAGAAGGRRSASPSGRRPGLARQILHNLNIFSEWRRAARDAWPPEPAPTSRGVPGAPRAPAKDEPSARRHSVDTVSTYLSQESKGSTQGGSVSELLDCSAGSDDVFECGGTAGAADREEDDDDDEWVCGSPASAWVRSAGVPQWGAVCWRCRRPLRAGALQLRRCQHMLHAACLRRLLADTPGPARVECLVCGEVYREGEAEPAPPAPPPRPPSQPPGSMSWRLQPVALPHTDCDTSILITYNFQSGVQGPWDPAPGAPYFAVGFPRESVLPASALGRRVLALVSAAWARGRLFAVRASRTTGREHVVAWCAAPPPARPHHYARGLQVLLAARDALLALLEGDA